MKKCHVHPVYGTEDLNPQPLKHESSPITIRPGLHLLQLVYETLLIGFELSQLKVSVTRFAENWPLLLNAKSIWQVYTGLFSGWQKM